VHYSRFVSPDKSSTSDEEPRRWSKFIESKVAIAMDETINHVTKDEKKKLQDVLPIQKYSGGEEEDDQLS
jgi:hypothetical protein